MDQNSSYFQVYLNGLKLDQKQSFELESEIQKTTIKYIEKIQGGKEFLNGAVSLKPNPEGPTPWPPFPFPIPRPWPLPLPGPYPGFFPIRKSFLDDNFIAVSKLF